MTPQLDNFKAKHLGPHRVPKRSHNKQTYSSNNGDSSVTYDDANRKITEQRIRTDTLIKGSGSNTTSASSTKATDYRYDKETRVTQARTDIDGLLSTDSGTVTLYNYNVQNQLIAVKDSNNQLIARYSYDLRNRRIWKENTAASQAQHSPPPSAPTSCMQTKYLSPKPPKTSRSTMIKVSAVVVTPSSPRNTGSNPTTPSPRARCSLKPRTAMGVAAQTF